MSPSSRVTFPQYFVLENNGELFQLRTVLPEMNSGRRLSKFETLQMAQQYIDCLAEILNKPRNK